MAAPQDTESALAIGNIIGSGSYGTVYRGIYDTRKAAIKQYHVSQHDIAKKAIEAEISILAGLQCRYIIQFYGTMYIEDKLVLIMDFAEGGSLKRAIEQGRLSSDWSTKRRIAQEMANGLAYIHRRQIIHRDLKSANVLLTRFLEVRLCDFGLAVVKRTSAACHSTDKMRGTIRWMAPEVLGNRSRYSNQSDVYALGMVMWEMAANCTTPFKDEHNEALIARAVERGERESLPSDTPVDYRRWVEQCWQKNPLDRPEACEMSLDDEDQADHENSEFTAYSTVNITDEFEALRISPATSRSTVAAAAIAATPVDTIPQKAEVSAPSTPPLSSSSAPRVAGPQATGFDLLLQQANANDIEAQLMVAEMYSVLGNDQDAFPWYLRAATQEGGEGVGHPQAQYYVADCYYKGKGVEQSFALAATWFKTAAEQGHVEAQCQLGQMYDFGMGVERNLEMAVLLYTEAAEVGNDRNAQFALGCHYESGQGVDKSASEAIRWYRMAADQGHGVAKNSLAELLAHHPVPEPSAADHAVVVDDTKRRNPQPLVDERHVDAAAAAATTSNIALAASVKSTPQRGKGRAPQAIPEADNRRAPQGESPIGNHTPSNNTSNRVSDDGQGAAKLDNERDKENKSIEWYFEASERGDVIAQYDLACMFLGGQRVDQSDQIACCFFKMAADQGHKDAQGALGTMLMMGRGVDRDDARALYWLQKGAEQGSAQAQNNLGYMHLMGQGVFQSDDIAASWYYRAAEQGNAEAQEALGGLYQDGRGVVRSSVEAARWFRKAADQGMALSQLRLGSMYLKGRGVPQSAADGVWWCRKAAEQGYAEAQNFLGILYQEGRSIGQSDSQAAFWYRLAAEQGYASAQYNYGQLLERGRGVPHDLQQALYWYIKAEAQGDANAKQRVRLLTYHSPPHFR